MTLSGGKAGMIALGEATPGARTPWWIPAALGAALVALMLTVTRMAMSDDAYITLSLARSVALRGEWAVTPGLWTHTATSPLQVLLVAAVTVLVRDAVLATAVVAVLAGAALSASVSAASSLRCGSWWAGPLVVALLACSPVMQATTGLESWTAAAITGVALWTAVERRHGALGVAAGLLVLARPDLGVVAVVAVVLAGRGSLRALAWASATVAPIVVASLLIFGSLVPDTLVWKQSRTDEAAGSAFGAAVPMLWQWWPAATAISGALVVAGLAALAWWVWQVPSSPVTALGAALLVAHPATLWVIAPPAHSWYHAPMLVGASLLLTLVAVRGAHLALAACVGLLAAGGLFTAMADYSVPPMHWNGASADQYRQVVELVPDRAVVETAHGEVGAIAWWCDTRCTVVDPLSDPGRMAPVIERARQDSALVRALTPLWSPAVPVPADLVTRYATEGGVSTWTGFGARWNRIDVVPAG